MLVSILHIQSQFRSLNKKGICNWNPAETKITMVLIYYGVFLLTALIYFSVASTDLDTAVLGIQQYFVCEAAGSGMECDRSSFDQFGFYMGMLVYIMIGFLPAVNLVFVINWTATRRSCRRVKKKYSQWILTHSRSTAHVQNSTLTS